MSTTPTPPSEETALQTAETPPAPASGQTAAGPGNFLAALGAGTAAALVGAVVWAAITVSTGYQIGWVAVGVGFLVGIAVRVAGKGSTQKFAIAGALFALLGCAAGNLLSVVGFVAQAESAGFFTVLGRLTPAVAVELMQLSFEPMDLLFYGIALYEGFKLSVIPAESAPAAT